MCCIFGALFQTSNLEVKDMASYPNFDRQYRFSAGPAGGTGFEVGAGVVPIHVNFSFQKTDLQSQNTGKVSLWNLNKSELSVLNEKDCAVELKAGYGSRMSKIFSGLVSYVNTSNDNADRKTDIEVIDNLAEIRDTYVSISYNGKVNWKTIFDDVGAQMGVAVSYSYNAEFVDVANGFSYDGMARNILDKGCKCCNLVWILQNGVLKIKKPGEVIYREVYLLSPDTGLLGIPARVTITQEEATGKNQLGWDVEYFLNGAINIDDYVKIESETVTGYFRVYSIEITGDNVSGDWKCKARVLEVD